jgi:uncharacterized protein YbjT (DUF2867 family)
MKTAIVLGATGLVGSALVQQLLQDNGWQKVKVFVRRSTHVRHPKLEEFIIDFDRPDEWRHLVTGDVLFSAFGTTIRKAGSQEAQYKIDYTYQYQMAEAAAANDVPVYVLVSAAYASPESKIFYSRIKGELERDVRKLPFRSVHFLQPGMLTGHRHEVRVGEKMGIMVMTVVGLIPILRRFRPIQAAEVARAMIHAAERPYGGTNVYTMGKVFRLAKGEY